MYRLLTLIWAVGVVLFASQAQAVTPKGDEARTVRKAESSEVRKSSGEARKYQRKASSAAKTRRAYRSNSKTHRVAHSSRKATRTARSSQTKAYRSARRTRATRVARDGGSFQQRSHPLLGIASYYWQPQRVASGGWFNPNAMTAAHKTLPFGTKVRVTNKRNGRTVDVTINDRGPYIAGRIIDLSSAAAGVIGMKSAGVTPVSVEVVGR